MTNKIKLKKYEGKEIDLANDLTRYFLSMNDKEFQSHWISKYPTVEWSDKQNISFTFTCESDSTYLVIFADNLSFNNPFIIETKERYIDNVGIFIPGKTYYWKVKDKYSNNESEIDTFKTLNSPVRWISAGTVYNVRDIGGWATDNNKRVKYGYIYRGAQLKLDNQWEKSYMNDYSYQAFDYLGINTEVELRGGFDHKESQIHDYTKNIYINGIGYEHILCMDDNQKEQYRTLFRALTDKSTYPLYFHCSWGADRTGVLAFLISGILGVPYDNLCEEYELTSFSGSGKRTRIDFPWKQMLPDLYERYGNKPLKDLLNQYLIEYIGVKQEEIDALRDIMLEDNTNNTNTHKVTYCIDGNVYIETKVYDGQYVSNIGTDIYLDRCFDYWMLNGKKYDTSLPVHSDLVLEAKFIKIEYEDYDVISLRDLGLGDSYDLKEAKDFEYKPKSSNGSRIFNFKYHITSKDNKFDDGVHIEMGKLWDYKAHIWLQDLTFQRVYTNKENLSLTCSYKFEYDKTYKISIGVVIPKNGIYKNKKMLFLTINDEVITLIETTVDLNINTIGLAGTKGILYNID